MKKDGTFHATEVVSKTDDITKLQLRNEEAMAQLPEQTRGDINLVDYTRSHQVPTKGAE